MSNGIDLTHIGMPDSHQDKVTNMKALLQGVDGLINQLNFTIDDENLATSRLQVELNIEQMAKLRVCLAYSICSLLYVYFTCVGSTRGLKEKLTIEMQRIRQYVVRINNFSPSESTENKFVPQRSRMILDKDALARFINHSVSNLT